jgi:dTDP-4-dehydrorhamnose reductase
MKIVVVGCNGQVGRALIHRGGSHGFKMLGISKETLNITSKKMVYDVLHSLKPNLLINAAAYTKVDLAEKEVDKAFEVNEKALFYYDNFGMLPKKHEFQSILN